MNATNFHTVLLARKRIVLVCLALTVMTAMGLNLLLPKMYKASTTLLLQYSGADPVTGAPPQAQMITNMIATQADIASSNKVALQVVDKLGLAAKAEVRPKSDGTLPTMEERRVALAGWLLENLEVKSGRESSVLKLTFKANNPQLAASIVNTYASEYQHASSRIKADPARNARSYFDTQVKSALKRLEEAQARLSKLQKDNGIVNVDSRYDVENARLNELSTQLVAIQAQLADARSRSAQANGNAAGSPEITSNPLIQNLTSELARARAQFSYVAERFKESHPRYQEQKAEMDRIAAELNRQIGATASRMTNNTTILQQREAEIRAAYQAQKTKLLDLNRLRDQLSILTHEIENAQKTYNAVSQRHSEVSIEGQANQSDVSVLSVATVPTEPSSPKMGLNLVAAVFMGLLLGGGLAFLAELMDQRIRCTGDIAQLMDAPLLGILRRQRTEPRLLAMARRALPN